MLYVGARGRGRRRGKQRSYGCRRGRDKGEMEGNIKTSSKGRELNWRDGPVGKKTKTGGS